MQRSVIETTRLRVGNGTGVVGDGAGQHMPDRTLIGIGDCVLVTAVMVAVCAPGERTEDGSGHAVRTKFVKQPTGWGSRHVTVRR